MKKKWIYIAAAVAALLMIASQASGYRGYNMPGKPHGYCPQMSGHWAETLDLTDAQKDQIRAMNQSFIDENGQLREQLYARHQEMRQLWSETDPDQEKIIAKQREIDEIKNRLRDNATQHRMKMRTEVLTGEQREKLSQMMKDRNMMRDYRGGGAPRGKPGRGGARPGPGGMGW